MNMESQSCAVCHQPLPRNSKLTLASVSREEAEQNGWTGHENPDGTVTVNMCLQCQIDRSNSRTMRELQGTLKRSYGSREKS
jgi:hypothetical protein